MITMQLISIMRGKAILMISSNLSDMATVSNIGQMAPTMKVNGPTTKLRAMVPSGMPRETCTEVTSRTTWPMVTEITRTSTVADTEVSSEMMSKREMAKKNGSMEPSMLEATSME